LAKLVCHDLSNKEIAEALSIRHGTVKTHIKNIYRRIHVKNKVALLLRFMADVSGLLSESAGNAVIPIVDAEA
jgi:DNA-binding NarL/FixJ family response regulator